MAFRGWRYAVLGAAMTLCATVTASTAYYDSGGGRTAPTVSAYSDIFVITLADLQPVFDLKVVAEHKQIVRNYPAYRSHPIKQHASGAAVRPTSVSGWRSGRTRTLAG